MNMGHRNLRFILVTALLSANFLVPPNAESNQLENCRNHAAVQSKPEAQKTIVDFLVEIPPELLGWNHAENGKAWSREDRLKRIKICDEANGYLEIDPSNDFDADYLPVLALFKRKDKSPLIGFAFQNDHLLFLAKDTAGWKDVTEKVMPRVSDVFINKKITEKLKAAHGPKTGQTQFTTKAEQSALLLELPRKGTNIRALCNVEGLGLYKKELFKLKFKNDRFEIDEK